MTHWRTLLAQRVLHGGGVVAYPTEAVWGLGCLPNNLDGVLRILALKRRPIAQGLILVAADIAQFAEYFQQLSSEQLAHLQSQWPAPITYLVEHGGFAPPWITGGRSTVALRVSDHPVVRELCRACRSPLVSTSANPGGKPPARTLLQVRRYFDDELDLIYPGAVGGRSEVSEIRELATDQIVRAG
jgi:L-threonylcarbamoyladenylate synthase